MVDEVPVAVPDGSAMVRDYTGPIELSPATPAVELVIRARRTAELAKSHEEHAKRLISMIDYIEFSIQQQVQVIAFDAFDTTPSLEVGQQRDFASYGGGGSSFGGRLLGSPHDTRWSFIGTGRISLDGIAEPDGKVPLARWWYLKALASPLAIDSYLALWTALELLSRIEKATVHGTLKLQCGHELSSCPVCDKPTAKEVNGLTMRKYLRSYGVNDGDAEVMWRLRQAVHGRNMFGEEESRQLERQLGQLRAVVFVALKKCLMIQIDELPAVTFAGGPVISGWASLAGIREIGHDDVQLEQKLVLQEGTM